MVDQDEPQTNRRRSTLLPSMPTFLHKERRTQYIARTNRPRWVLHMQAVMWRFLMSLGMFFHKLAPPRPPRPNFWRSVETSISGKPGNIYLYFYTPPDYETQKRLWNRGVADEDSEETDQNKIRKSMSSIGDIVRRRSRSARRWGGYPVVINFHGGGFTLGSAHDDARWCGTVVNELNAVVISVDYRLAPEYPFPTAVEDGVDAVVWVYNHARELGINKDKIALSGFSSGANMCFTVPLRLYDQQTGFARNDSDLDLSKQPDEAPQHGAVKMREPGAQNSEEYSGSDASTQVASENANVRTVHPEDAPPPVPGQPRKQNTSFLERGLDIPEIKIACIVPWYPSLDYTRTREERRATCKRADQELPALFTDLFDDSYLHPPKDVALDSPYLSPGIAPTMLLRNGLPQDIIMHTCEWDMLLDEGEAFHERLISDEISKTVHYTMVPGVPHGWDKAPNPWKPTPGVREHYLKAIGEMKRILQVGNRRMSTLNEEAQPRKSMVR